MCIRDRLGIGVNTKKLKELNIPAPQCYADLIKPEYKGYIQYPDPRVSGTGYSLISTFSTLWGAVSYTHLTDIGQSFDMQSSDVGLMMTVYAWTVMIMSLPAMLATGDMERKGLLLKLFVIFIIGHIISVIAWNYWILLIARMCIAVAPVSYTHL